MNTELKHKVLVIDDEMGPRESLRILLMNEYKVLLADNVDDGVALFKSEQPDLVILDIRMPQKGGIEGLREIRDLDRDVSVIILTGYGELQTAKDAIMHQASRYMSKPFDAGEMMAAVKQAVEITLIGRRKNRADERARELDNQLKKLIGEKDQMSSLGLASSAFAHDMRNPLMIVLAYVEMLSERLQELQMENGAAEDEISVYLTEIEKNLNRCNRLAHDWNLLGKPDSIRFCKLSLNNLLTDTVDSAQLIAQTHKVGLTTEICDSDIMVMGEPTLLERAFMNLIKNAVQASSAAGDTGLVKTILLDQGESVQIIFRDNGCGIDADKISWIFDPFNTERDLGQGFGLGLFITKEVVERHSGQIDFDSKLGEGTTVCITLPKLR